VRLTLLALVALLGTTTLPASALAVAPVNDAMGNALQLSPNYATSATPPPCSDQVGWHVCIPATQPLGGWNDATSTDDAGETPPSCFGTAGFHSMWYRLRVPESGVLTIALSSDNVKDYQPLVTIINDKNTEVACSLGGTALVPGQAVMASSYVAKDTDYLIRIASAVDNPNNPTDENGLPGLQRDRLEGRRLGGRPGERDLELFQWRRVRVGLRPHGDQARLGPPGPPSGAVAAL
jgi:hypothetical protein